MDVFFFFFFRGLYKINLYNLNDMGVDDILRDFHGMLVGC